MKQEHGAEGKAHTYRVARSIKGFNLKQEHGVEGKAHMYRVARRIEAGAWCRGQSAYVQGGQKY